MRTSENNLLQPTKAKIEEVLQETEKEKRFKISLCNDGEISFRPGQFIILSLMGVGEAPFSITSDASIQSSFEICVRNVGAVSSTLHSKKAGDIIWVRGPYGSFFDTAVFERENVVFIAGGLGLVPLRPAILECIQKSDRYKSVTLLYGSKNIRDMVYRQIVSEWENQSGLDIDIILDDAKGTDYKQGLITSLIDEREYDKDTNFVICGPPIMYRFVIKSLQKKGVSDDCIWLSLERHMKCGVGKCGHCRLDDICVCEKGPVFNYPQIRDKRGAI